MEFFGTCSLKYLKIGVVSNAGFAPAAKGLQNRMPKPERIEAELRLVDYRSQPGGQNAPLPCPALLGRLLFRSANSLLYRSGST